MNIRETEIDVDIAEELEPYVDEMRRAVVRGNKLQACSPFRYEDSPSFAVNLDTGVWIDSGAVDEHWYKGNLVKLLAFFQGVTYGEVEDYLLTKYKQILADVDSLTLDIQLEGNKTPSPLSLDRLNPFAYRHPYLANRGISERVQRSFKIGYDKSSNSVVIPWLEIGRAHV